MRNLVSDYIVGEPGLMAFFAKSPVEIFHESLKPAHIDPDLVAAIAAYQERVGSAAEIGGHEIVIATGQQPGLFTGPLYTIYKAVTAVALAQKLQSRFRAPCVPIFWNAGADHDFEEVRTAHFLTKDHEILSLRYDPSQDVSGFPIYRVPVENSLHALIDRAASETPGSESRSEIATFLHESLDASNSLADWTARILARLFRGTPLVLFAPDLPEACASSAPILAQEIERPLAATRLINEAGKGLEALGYSPQVVKAEKECCFFVEVSGRRRKVLFDGDGYVLPEEGVRFTVDEMRAQLEEAPQRFSPNVALRPVVEQRLLQPAAYVAGPGEIAYWPQLKGVFEHFREEMPIVYPRARCVLTSVKLNKLLAKSGLIIADLYASSSELLERALRSHPRTPALDIVERYRGELTAVVDRLRTELQSHDVTGASMAKQLAGRVASDLERIERALLQADESRVKATEKQIARLCTALAPWRKPQERVYTIFSFLFEHGWGLIPRLVEELDIESFEMNEVEL